MAETRACSASRRGQELESRWLALAAANRDGKKASCWRSLERKEEESRVESPKQNRSAWVQRGRLIILPTHRRRVGGRHGLSLRSQGVRYVKRTSVSTVGLQDKYGTGSERREKRNYKARWTQPRSARVHLYKNNDVSALELLSIFRWNSRTGRPSQPPVYVRFM